MWHISKKASWFCLKVRSKMRVSVRLNAWPVVTQCLMRAVFSWSFQEAVDFGKYQSAMASFYATIDSNFGTETKQVLKAYADQNRKWANMKTRKDFLVLCRKEGVFPPHIQQSFKSIHALLEERSPFLRKLERCISRFQKTVLSLEIKHTFFKLKMHSDEMENLRRLIRQQLDADIAERFLEKQTEFQNRSVQTSASPVHRKLNKIIQKIKNEPSTPNPTLNVKAIHNASGKTMPPEVEVLLSLGPNFALPYTQIAEVPFYHLLADVENIIGTHPDPAQQEETRCGIVNCIQNYIHRNRGKNSFRDPQHKFLDSAIVATRRFVKENPDTIILKADKGNQTVVMLRTDYDEKMNGLLNDTATYKKLPRDPTNGFQSKNNTFVTRLLDLKLIDSATARRMKTYKATCPKIYGQPKTHKPGLPLRPVVPCMTAPTYELSKFLCGILQKSLISKYNIKSSFEFCSYINTVTLPDDYILVSLDVVSLFTCIPKTLMIESIFKRWDSIDTNINLSLFVEIAQFVIDCSYFQFQDKFFLQEQGTAMGNPFSPIIADYVTETILDNVVNELSFDIPVCKKYVDDLVLAVPRTKVNEVLEVFNRQNENIQFTIEHEVEGRLPFLDMILVRKQDQTIKTEWYRKPISSGRFLNYHSLHPIHHKLNVACNFIRRVSDFSTNISSSQAMTIIHRELARNDYPKQLTSRMINRYGRKKQQQQRTSGENNITAISPNASQTADRAEQALTENKETRFLSMINVNNLTEDIRKILHRHYTHITIAVKHMKTISTLYPMVKTKTPTEQQSNVVYRIPCTQCESVYVGMTTNQLRTRISGHRSLQNKVEKLREKGQTPEDREMGELQEKTALIKHCVTTGHAFNLTETRILDRTFKQNQLAFLEMCHIRNTDHTVNKKQDTENLNIAYAGILHNAKNITREKGLKRNQNKTTNCTKTQTANMDVHTPEN